MRQTLAKTITVGLASSILLLLAACTAPVDTKGSVTLRQGLTLQWQVKSARSLYPATYPTPTTYDLLLHSAGQTDVVVTGISTTSWTLENLARVVWTVTVTGKDGAGKSIVQGGTSVDLSVSATQTSTVTLQYLSQGTGSGSIHLSLDLSDAPTTPDTVTLALTDPVGTTTHPAISINGTTASFTLDPAPVGAYSVYFFVEAGLKSAGKFETLMVFQNVDTAATLKFLGGDFDTTFHPVTGVSLDRSELQLYTNNVSASLTATVAPANATNPSVAWTSSDDSVATVSQAGLVVPKAVGMTTVKVTTGEGSFEATCEVTVSVKHVVGVSVTPVNLTLVQEGTAAQLTATVNPSDASDVSYTWSSSNTSVATVNASGVVTPVVAGSATITATSTDGAKKGTSAVTVLPNGTSSGTLSVLTPTGSSITISGPSEYVIGRVNVAYSATSDKSLVEVQWRLDGTLLNDSGTETLNLDVATVTPGAHILTFLGKDSQGLSSSASAKISATCHVIFDANGGTGTMADQIMTSSVPAALRANTLSRVGYTFGGWNTAADGSGTNYTNEAIVTIGNTSLKLFAHWTQLVITVTYNANGGTGTMPDQVVGRGQVATLSQNSFTKPGYIFGAWSTVSSGATGSFAESTNFQMPDFDFTFYAQWHIPVSAVSLGGAFMMLKSDGTLWASGSNTYGEVGDGTKLRRTRAVQLMADVRSVSAGYQSTKIVKNDGTLWATGGNSYGNLGDGTTVDKNTPVMVMTNVSAVSEGTDHSMILKSNGTLWATGANYAGQLGDGTNIDRSTPIQVMEGVSAVSAGTSFTMILKNDGSLWATGQHDFGKLGDGDENGSNINVPIEIMTGVSAVSASLHHTMILKVDGSLWVCGDNTQGALGDGTNVNRYSPVLVASSVSAVAAGFNSSVILKQDGTVWTTGWNSSGELGDETTVRRNTFGQVMAGAAAIAAGLNTTMILMPNGALWASGGNGGTFGNQTTANSNAFVRIY